MSTIPAKPSVEPPGMPPPQRAATPEWARRLMLPLDSAADTRFAADGDSALRLVCLCGMPLGRQGPDSGPAPARGMALIQVNGRRHEADALMFTASEIGDGGARCRWLCGDTGLQLSARWRTDPATGIVSRVDTLENIGDRPAIVTRCLARVVLPPGSYEIYAQTSRWCRENQGAWQALRHDLRLTHLSGRTTEGATPYLAIRHAGTETGIVFHVLPRGNWTIRVNRVPSGGDPPFAVVELGLADENLCRHLAPGDSVELPEILMQALPGGDPARAAPGLHRYLLRTAVAGAKPEAPVIYNTWFDQFERLDLARLHQQLAAAREAGCEIVVLDAGWYGAGGSNWWAQAGDWREKTDAACCGRMRAFADDVRAAGLGFGLWMEPERFGPDVPIRARHPEWFVPVGNGAARMDLTQPAACAWLRSEIGRLVETYDLAWMKIDSNFTFDTDATGAELADYNAVWHRLLDEIRVAYPGTFFEGCASGAMRADLTSLRHVDGHFLSDSVNPIDMLRITQGAWLRLPPGRLIRWSVLRSAGQVVPRYTLSLSDSPPALLTPRGALWEPAETVDLDFALLAAMPGMWGLSGDLAGLPACRRARIAQGVAFYKRWRRLITGAVGSLLTPPRPITCRDGWIGLQLQAPDTGTSLVFVYRLGHAGAPPPVIPRGLDAARSYRVAWGLVPDCSERCGGDILMRNGLPPEGLALGNHAAQVFVVEAI